MAQTTELAPRVIGTGVARAGIACPVGGFLRFVAPALFEAVVPAYAVTVFTEAAFCLALPLGWTEQRRMRPA